MSHSLLPTTRPPLRSLEVAVIVMQYGSLTAAAEALGLTHGAVSRQIKALETSLGLKLFDRHGRGVRPTPEGHKYLRVIQRNLDAIDAESVRWYQRRGRHVVHVGVTPTFAYLWLLRRIPALQRGNPALRIEVHAEAGFADIGRGEVDCVIRYTQSEHAPPNATLFIGERLCPVAGRELAAELGPDPDPEAILEQPLLHDTNATKWRAWSRAATGRPFRPSPRDRRFENYLLTLEAARSGLGIALGQYPIAADMLDDLGLVPVSSVLVESPIAYYLIQRDVEPSEGVQAFMDRLFGALVTPGPAR